MDVIRLFSDGFPLTIERLQFLQNTYIKAFSQLSKIAGAGNIIIDGVIVSGGNVSAGVIILNGEILAFEGGTLDARVAVFETVNNVPYNVDDDDDGNLDLKVADVVRVARCAATGGIDSFDFSTLVRVGNLQTLAMPIGSIIPFDGDPNNLPIGWELYDMADRFIMGAGGNAALNDEGGVNSITINQSNIPNFDMTGTTTSSGSHNHYYKDSYHLESITNPSAAANAYGSEFIGAGFAGSGATDYDNGFLWYKDRNTASDGDHTHIPTVNSGGAGAAMENRPKFRALLFIKRVAI